MIYLHYWHFNKNWYAVLNSQPNPRRVYWHGVQQDPWGECVIKSSTLLTHRQIKQLLTEGCPNVQLIRDVPYHEGRRWFGNKSGSRKNRYRD